MSRWCAGCRARASPEGRRAVTKLLPNKLYYTVTRLRRVCGQTCRGPGRQIIAAGAVSRSPHRQVSVAGVVNRNSRRGRSTAGVCTATPRNGARDCLPGCSRASRATFTPPTVFPSPRAHEPLSCRARDPFGPGRQKIFKKSCSCGPDCSGGTQMVNCKSVQLTNRRMRTFIATPSARNVNNTEDPP